MCKDRQNWAGKAPKRQLFHGPPSPFDWEAELESIREALEAELARTTSGASTSTELARTTSGVSTTAVIDSDSESDRAPPLPCAPPSKDLSAETKPSRAAPSASSKDVKFDVDWLSTCLSCKIAVWVGPPERVLAGVCLACPRDADWEQENAEPYCDTCWETEQEFLTGLASEHKGKGGKIKKAPAKKKAKAPAKKKVKAPAKKKVKVKAKKKVKAKAPAKKNKTVKQIEELRLKVVIASNDAATQAAIQAASSLPATATAVQQPAVHAVQNRKTLGGIPGPGASVTSGRLPPAPKTRWEVCLHTRHTYVHHTTSHHITSRSVNVSTRRIMRAVSTVLSFLKSSPTTNIRSNKHTISLSPTSLPPLFVGILHRRRCD